MLEVDNGERPEEKNKYKTYVINFKKLNLLQVLIQKIQIQKHFLSAPDFSTKILQLGYKCDLKNLKRQQKEASNSFRITITFSQKIN